MTRTSIAATGLFAMTLAAVVVPALPAEAQEARWFHVRVEEPGETRVSVNLPLALLEVGLDIADRHMIQNQEFHWQQDGKISVDDLRRMWTELEAAGDASFVEIEDGDTRVSISQRGDRVLIRTDEGDRSQVRMEMPSVVVQALLGTDGDRLNLRDAVRELARSGRQDILEVQDGETTVRVWIGETVGSR